MQLNGPISSLYDLNECDVDDLAQFFSFLVSGILKGFWVYYLLHIRFWKPSSNVYFYISDCESLLLFLYYNMTYAKGFL